MRKSVLLIGILMPAMSVCAGQQPSPLLHLEREIPLPGVQGRIDHMAADVTGKRLFVAALGNGTVEVIDLAESKVSGEIKGLKEPQGVAFVPETGTVYVAGGGDGTVRSFDGRSLKATGSVALGEDADNLRYDAQSKTLLAGYGSGAIAELGLDLSKRGNFSLPAHPESFQLDADGQRLFVNLPDNHSVALIDLKSKAVNPNWAHPSASANFSMAVDKTIQRIFVPCRKPTRMLVLNTETGTMTAWAPTLGDVDDVFVDEARRLVYVIGGDGAVDVVYVRAADAMVSKARIITSPGARTGLYVPEWNELLVAAPAGAGKEARILVFSTGQ
jgi:YVTN family beta-propeller protein